MPTYVCIVSGKTLTVAQKREIAAHITRVHSELTGAPQFFAQVFFAAPAGGDHFMGGILSEGEQVFIRGEIRAGRSAEVKRKLVVDILAGVSRISGIGDTRIWVYLNELPAGQMAEYGRVLPEPGGEAPWIEALPTADRERVKRLRPV
jgi:phenylpyruvate tautomerase PptA (4-oxalocrotonate tautomerase family)